MRPWSERLLDLVRPRPGERCLALLCESDVLSRMLRRAVGPSGEVADWDTDAAPPRRDWEVAVSLFGLAAQPDAAALLGRTAGVLDAASGRLAAAVWAGAAGAPHEAAVRAGLAEVGLVWPGLDTEIRLDAAGLAAGLPRSLRVRRLRDVVRFDAAGHLWAALVDERDPPPAIAAAAPAAIEEALRVCASRLHRHTAADGTLRIPVEALVVERAG